MTNEGADMSVTLHEWFYAHALQGLFLGIGTAQTSVPDQAIFDRAWDLADRMETAFREAGSWTELISTRHHFFAGKMLVCACNGTHNYGPNQFHDVVRRAFELGSLAAATEDRAAGGGGIAPAFPMAAPPVAAPAMAGVGRAAPIMLARPQAPAPPAVPVAVTRPHQAEVKVTIDENPPPLAVIEDWLDPTSVNAQKVTKFWRQRIPDLPALIKPGEKGAEGASKFRVQLIEMYKGENAGWEREYRAEIGQDPMNFQR